MNEQADTDKYHLNIPLSHLSYYGKHHFFFSQVVCNNILPIKCNKMSLVSRKVTVFLEKGPESAATHLFLFALSCFSCPKYTQAIHNQGSQLATMKSYKLGW